MKGQEVHMLPDLFDLGKIKITVYVTLRNMGNCYSTTVWRRKSGYIISSILYSVIKHFLFENCGLPAVPIWIIKYNITNSFNLAFQTFKTGEAGK